MSFKYNIIIKPRCRRKPCDLPPLPAQERHWRQLQPLQGLPLHPPSKPRSEAGGCEASGIPHTYPQKASRKKICAQSREVGVLARRACEVASVKCACLLFPFRTDCLLVRKLEYSHYSLDLCQMAKWGGPALELAITHPRHVAYVYALPTSLSSRMWITYARKFLFVSGWTFPISPGYDIPVTS